jgi:hypothetical protein
VRFATGGVAIVLLTTTLIGCGSEDEVRLTRRDWIRRADAICREENERRAALTPPAFDPASLELTPEQLLMAADFLDQSLAISDDTTERLETLGYPSQGEGDVEDILEERAEGRDEILLAIEAAGAGDVEEFRTRFGRGSADFADAAELAAEFGLEDCGQPA